MKDQSVGVALFVVAAALLAPIAAHAATGAIDEECFDACYDEAVELCREEGESTEEECDEDAVALCEDECNEEAAALDDDPAWDDGMAGIRPPEGLATTCRGCAAGGDPSTTLGGALFAIAVFALGRRAKQRREINR